MNRWLLRWYQWSGRIDLVLLPFLLMIPGSDRLPVHILAGMLGYAPLLLPLTILLAVALGVAELRWGDLVAPAQLRAISLQRSLVVQLGGYTIGWIPLMAAWAKSDECGCGSVQPSLGLVCLLLIQCLRCLTFSRHLYRGIPGSGEEA